MKTFQRIVFGLISIGLATSFAMALLISSISTYSAAAPTLIAQKTASLGDSSTNSGGNPGGGSNNGGSSSGGSNNGGNSGSSGDKHSGPSGGNKPDKGGKGSADGGGKTRVG
jgi:hypothetical protein